MSGGTDGGLAHGKRVCDGFSQRVCGFAGVDGAAALKTSGMMQICCRNFHKTLDFSLRIWYPI